MAFAAAPFNGDRIGYLNIGRGPWMSVLTLTQVWIGKPEVLNPVYWSLCYEEQFYIVMALTLLAAGPRRLHVLLALTLAAAAYCLPIWPSYLRPTGFFLAYWLSFASSIAAYAWLRMPARRWFAINVFACIAIALGVTHDVALAISTAAALAFVALAPYDETLARTRAGAALIAAGLFWYSVYLVHVPIGGRVVNGLMRLQLPLLVPSIAGIAASLAAGWIFYVLVERRFLNAVVEPADIPLAKVS